MNHTRNFFLIGACIVWLLITPHSVLADAVIDWNIRACEIAGPSNFDTPTSNRVLAIMHTAIYEAVNAITKKYPAGELKIDAPASASIDAAIAAAGRTTLLKIAPAKEAEIEAAYQAALAKIPDGIQRVTALRSVREHRRWYSRRGWTTVSPRSRLIVPIQLPVSMSLRSCRLFRIGPHGSRG